LASTLAFVTAISPANAHVELSLKAIVALGGFLQKEPAIVNSENSEPMGAVAGTDSMGSGPVKFSRGVLLTAYGPLLPLGVKQAYSGAEPV
jgi:hypothetical protein